MSIIIYFVIGGVSFVVNFAVFFATVHAFGLNWVIANTAGFLVAVLVNYLLSARLVFESRLFAQRRVEVALTILVSALGTVLETAIIHVAYDVSGFDLNLSKLGAAGLVFFWNYGARRFLVFGGLKQINWLTIRPNARD